jgi:hypothetical protein
MNILVKFGYDSAFIFPHKEGIQVIEAFSKALKFKDGYSSNSTIENIEEGTISFSLISDDRIKEIKTAMLLSNENV